MREGNVIEVRDVHKKFRNYFDKSNNLKEKILHRNRNKYQEYWVLKGMDFEVKRGEVVGLIGCNGCGKSTTLKLLTKIIYPDKGEIEVKGRVSSLLELGAGFHPDLSGYENIYLNAAVFGLTRKEIDKRVDEIIYFSELKDFINNPIRTYSSGMYMKLAFSVAINVEADILLIDEILGVGDVNFQMKCFEKLKNIKENGTTIVIVSHSTDQIERICDRSIWIEDGRVKLSGETKEIDNKYLESMNEKRLVQLEKEEQRRKLQYEAEGHANSWEKEQLLRAEYFEENKQRNLIAQIKQEKINQYNTLKEAEEKRKQVEALQKDVQIKLRSSSREVYLQSEIDRLDAVVEEKNLEIERLNSVIREKTTDIKRMESVLVQKENQLAQIVLDKDLEIRRLEEVVGSKV